MIRNGNLLAVVLVARINMASLVVLLVDIVYNAVGSVQALNVAF